MTRKTSAADLRSMAESCRRFAAKWQGDAGRAALLATALEFEQLAAAAAQEDERSFRRMWAETSATIPAAGTTRPAAEPASDTLATLP